jgi:hypothetical protein
MMNIQGFSLMEVSLEPETQVYPDKYNLYEKIN